MTRCDEVSFRGLKLLNKLSIPSSSSLISILSLLSSTTVDGDSVCVYNQD